MTDGSPHDWRSLVMMPDDDTQTLAEFVEWLADGWYDAKQALAETTLAANAAETRCAAAYRLLHDAQDALSRITLLHGGLGESLGAAKSIARSAIERMSRGVADGFPPTGVELIAAERQQAELREAHATEALRRIADDKDRLDTYRGAGDFARATLAELEDMAARCVRPHRKGGAA